MMMKRASVWVPSLEAAAGHRAAEQAQQGPARAAEAVGPFPGQAAPDLAEVGQVGQAWVGVAVSAWQWSPVARGLALAGGQVGAWGLDPWARQLSWEQGMRRTMGRRGRLRCCLCQARCCCLEAAAMQAGTCWAQRRQAGVPSAMPTLACHLPRSRNAQHLSYRYAGSRGRSGPL